MLFNISNECYFFLIFSKGSYIVGRLISDPLELTSTIAIPRQVMTLLVTSFYWSFPCPIFLYSPHWCHSCWCSPRLQKPSLTYSAQDRSHRCARNPFHGIFPARLFDEKTPGPEDFGPQCSEDGWFEEDHGGILRGRPPKWGGHGLVGRWWCTPRVLEYWMVVCPNRWWWSSRWSLSHADFSALGDKTIFETGFHCMLETNQS